MKRWLPTIVFVAVVAGAIAAGPIAQWVDYHRFADTRPLAGIPNAGDVLSNIAFALVAAWGLALSRSRALEPGYRLFLVSLALTAVGSAFYHLAPDDERLIFDRIPIALGCAGLLAGVRAETRGGNPRWVLPALSVVAVASVLWWWATRDLRPYLVLQGAPLLMIPLWQALAESPKRERIGFALAIAIYILAKVAELRDHAIFDAIGVMSGHTLKHLLAAVAAGVITATLVRRA
jgi:hypothetical protein